MRFLRLKPAALAAALLALAACDSMSTDAVVDPGAVAGALGTYTLQTINASPLPVVTRRDGSGGASIVTAGQLTLGGGTFYQSLTITDSVASGQSSSHVSGTQGTFTMAGDQIHFRASDGGTWDGTYRVTRIEYSITGNNGPIAFLFVRN